MRERFYVKKKGGAVGLGILHGYKLSDPLQDPVSEGIEGLVYVGVILGARLDEDCILVLRKFFCHVWLHSPLFQITFVAHEHQHSIRWRIVLEKVVIRGKLVKLTANSYPHFI